MVDLTEAEISDIVGMAWSDHMTFSEIEYQYGLTAQEVKELMRSTLNAGSYKVWRKRVRTFSDRRVSGYK
eukprot:g19697.t1